MNNSETLRPLIFDAVRTPRGVGKADGGALANVTPMDMLAQLLQALPKRSGLDPAAIEDVVLGCVTQVGDQGANPARIAVLHAGWPDRVPGLTINRFCTSGLDACAMAAARVRSGECGLLLGGGVESMSRVPMFSDKGAWYTDAAIMKSTRFTPLGISADLLATLEGLDRGAVDALALESQNRAVHAREGGRFSDHLIAVVDDDGGVVLDQDQPPRSGLSIEKLGGLPAVFAEMGEQGADRRALKAFPELTQIHHVHSPGNSPAPADGAALVLIGSEAAGQANGLSPRARILSWATAAADPVLMLTAAEDATELALRRAGLSAGDIDLWEVNEAFAATVLRYQRVFGIASAQLNVNGGAIALGHAMGATGAMLIGQLLSALDASNGRYGVVAVAGGGGLGSAMVVERVQ